MQLQAIAASTGVIGVSTEGVLTTPDGVVADALAQIRYLVEHVGLPSVVLGADFFRGPSADHPTASFLLPQLQEGFLKDGWNDQMLAAIGWTNWLRVLAATWRPPSAPEAHRRPGS